MIEIGKRRRLSRILRKNKRTLIIPMEWGTSFAPNDWDRCSYVARAAIEGGADALMTTYGHVRRFAEDFVDIPLVLTINYNLSDPVYPLEYVGEASQLGADAVKVHFFGPVKDMPALQLQKLSLECKNQGMPFLLELIPMSNSPSAGGNRLLDQAAVKEAVDMGVIIGADIIKTSYTGSSSSFKEVTKSCPVPVIIAGGSKLSTDKETLQMIRGAMDGGASGGAIGRNVTTHSNPGGITKAIAAIIHDNASVDEALKVLQ